jgi:hypothetical protein
MKPTAGAIWAYNPLAWLGDRWSDTRRAEAAHSLAPARDGMVDWPLQTVPNKPTNCLVAARPAVRSPPFGRHLWRPRKGLMRQFRSIAWLPLLAVAGPLLVGCADAPKPSFIGPNGPPDEAALQECRGEAAKAQVSGTAPADVRAEVAQGAMNSCMAKKSFYPQ